MGRKIQQLSIDGVSVDLSKARFAETFDVAEEDERLLAFDEEVVYVVIARVSTPSFRESKKNGEVSRVNVLRVKEARLVTNEELKSKVLSGVGFDYQPLPSVFDGLPPAEEVVPELTATAQWAPTIAELEQQGVRFVDELGEDGLPIEGIEVDEEVEVDEDMARLLATMKELNDEYENEPEDPDPILDGARKIVAEARGMRAKDPVLDRFLEATR